MRIGAARFLRRSISVGMAGLLVAVLAACNGLGGGYLPANSPAFTGPAALGFDFSCEDKGGLNPPTGQLRIQVGYVEHGSYPLTGLPFAVHGVVDVIDPVLESAICIGQNPPPGGLLIFLGRYWPAGTAPVDFPTSCPVRDSRKAPSCRFEVQVRDNDNNLAPSTGDYFSIQLSSSTVLDDELQPETVFYTRAGILEGGNVTVG